MGTKYSKFQKEQMVELRKDGYTLKEIAVKLDINNLTTIRNVCHEAGLPKKPYPPKIDYSIGQRFNNFVIVEKATHKITKTGKQYFRWLCKCDCDTLFIITTKQIRRGQKSCGCLATSGRFAKHNSHDVIAKNKLNHYISGAKRRNLIWELSNEKFIELLFGNCYYCGTDPITLIKSGSHKEKVNGIDRIDSNIGYNENNCVSCCKFCNRAKGNSTLEEFIEYIKKIVNFWKDKI